MKNYIKKASLLLLLTTLLAGCNSQEYPTFNPNGTYKIGILQPVEHEALKKAKNGFITALNEKGWIDGENITVVFRNAGGSASDLKTMAKSLVNECDLVLGIGTGAAQQIKSAQYNAGSKKPLLFTAVTDPVDASLVKTLENNEGYVTGTSDAQPIDSQIDLIYQFNQNCKKIGVFYTQTEINSAAQAKQAKQAIEGKGGTCIIGTCTNAADLKSAVSSLISKGVEAIYIPTDNNVAAHISLIKEVLQGLGILCVVGEEGMLTQGGHVTLSINYENLGKETGKMAASILSGEKKPNEIPVLTMKKEQCEFVYSQSNLDYANVIVPTDLITSDWRNID